jgi:hypothetical protein
MAHIIIPSSNNNLYTCSSLTGIRTEDIHTIMAVKGKIVDILPNGFLVNSNSIFIRTLHLGICHPPSEVPGLYLTLTDQISPDNMTTTCPQCNQIRGTKINFLS